MWGKCGTDLDASMTCLANASRASPLRVRLSLARRDLRVKIWGPRPALPPPSKAPVQYCTVHHGFGALLLASPQLLVRSPATRHRSALAPSPWIGNCGQTSFLRSGEAPACKQSKASSSASDSCVAYAAELTSRNRSSEGQKYDAHNHEHPPRLPLTDFRIILQLEQSHR